MAGTWAALANQPSFNASTMLLLTNGEVMCQDAGTSHWWKLQPDATGSYVNGTWSSLADGPNAPLYYASAVLADGRVFVAGGEYNNGATSELLAAEIYDPETDVWTTLATPAGWTAIGDASSCVLPDGRVLLGYLYDSRCAIYDPVANTWAAAANKLNSSSSEETWTLLPDQTVLTVDCPGHPGTQKYVIVADRWVTAGSTPSDLVEASSIEIGPAVLLPDGRVFAVGATGKTALYTMPPLANQQGTWAAGPTFPKINNKQLGAKDAPGCLLPNGKVLCVAGPVDGVSGNYLTPTYFFEYDPAANSLTAITNPSNSGYEPYHGRMLLLPTGQVLFANDSSDVEVYSPDGAPTSAWRPEITSAPSTVHPGYTYTLGGRQLNGLSQAVSYGDDAMMATNYPIVRIRNTVSGSVTYCRTHDHSTMGVQTGSVIHTTRFTVPSSIELGPSELCVIANGIDSICLPVGVTFKPWKEIKWEIKENLKREVDLIVEKRPLDFIKLKDAVGEGDPWRYTEDPEWLKAIRLLAERSDELESQVRKRSFIRGEERPAVGEEALELDEAQIAAATSRQQAEAAGPERVERGSVGPWSYRRAEVPPSRYTPSDASAGPRGSKRKRAAARDRS
jgi:hypothetical protein